MTLADRATIDARFDGDRIEVALPRDRTVEWARGDAVTLPADDPVATQATRVLVEKDFTCIDPRGGDDQSDLFPNPKARAS